MLLFLKKNKYSDKVVYKVNSHMLIRKCHYITAKEAICLSVALLVLFWKTLHNIYFVLQKEKTKLPRT